MDDEWLPTFPPQAGDHCYNEGDSDEKRADAYMQAFEQTVAQAPWMPIVGNHEFYAGTNLTRYLDSSAWNECITNCAV